MHTVLPVRRSSVAVASRDGTCGCSAIANSAASISAEAIALASSWPLPWLTLKVSPAGRIAEKQGMPMRSRPVWRANLVMPSEARCGRRRSTVCAAGRLRSPCSHQPAGPMGSPLTSYCRKNLRLGILGSGGIVKPLAATCVSAWALFNATVAVT